MSLERKRGELGSLYGVTHEDAGCCRRELEELGGGEVEEEEDESTDDGEFN